jgi:murein DD-endopeptidase MepM/ murein hydrolase activator NlpD
VAIPVLDRLLTIVVTATVTSAVWIVGGGTIMERARVASGVGGAAATPASAGAVPPPQAVFGAPAGFSRASSPPRPVTNGSGLLIPVSGVRPDQLVDTFTAARSGGRVHDAIDIMAPEGAPVVAAAPGTVEKLFLSHLGGKTVYVRSADRGTIYYYAHLRDYAAGLAEGRAITRGQPIGWVGHTGNASPGGPHLHFAVMQTSPQAKWWEQSTAINPYPLLAGRR